MWKGPVGKIEPDRQFQNFIPGYFSKIYRVGSTTDFEALTLKKGQLGRESKHVSALNKIEQSPAWKL